MFEMVASIAHAFTVNPELAAVYGQDRWIHGTFDAELRDFPRVAFKFVPTGGPRVDNTSTVGIYTHRFRFQNWAGDDEQAIWHQRMLERWFATEAFVLQAPATVQITIPPGLAGAGTLGDYTYPATTSARMADKPRLMAMDLFEEPGQPDPEFGRIWQGVLDIEYIIKRQSLNAYPAYIGEHA